MCGAEEGAKFHKRRELRGAGGEEVKGQSRSVVDNTCTERGRVLEMMECDRGRVSGGKIGCKERKRKRQWAR